MLANYVTRSSTTIFMAVFLTMGLMLISEVDGEKLDSPLNRPGSFEQRDDLDKYINAVRSYLKAADGFHLVSGRPRFGKRSLYEDYEVSQNLGDNCRLVCDK